MNGDIREVRCRRQSWGDGVELAVIEDHPDGALRVARPLEMVGVPRGQRVTEPTLTLSHSKAQRLMDELWQCGLRPTEGTGSAGSLAATERHLQDMQRIAFGLLNLDEA